MFARAYASAIRPITLGRELLALIDSMDKSGPINPNFVVNLNADDYTAFANIEKYLLREMAEAATQYAELNELRHDAPISVIFKVDPALKAGDFEVTIDTESVLKVEQSIIENKTNSTDSIATATQLIEAVLVLKTGERVVLDSDSLKIGRQASCRIVFNDSNVSREHAQMRRSSDGWKVLDLGSTNGTKINGIKIAEEQLLVNGDEVSFGTSSARFEIS